MIDFLNPNLCFLLLSTESDSFSDLENNQIRERAISILYSKEFFVHNVTGYLGNTFDKCLLGESNLQDSDSLRRDAIQILDTLKLESLIIKYSGAENFVKLSFDGSETLQQIHFYVNESVNKIYGFNGISFTFTDKKRYFFPKSKDDLKSKMIVEFFNEGVWKEKIVEDIENEYEKLYKLLIKYNKLRIPVNQN